MPGASVFESVFGGCGGRYVACEDDIKPVGFWVSIPASQLSINVVTES